MSAPEDLDQVIERHRAALGEIINGNPDGYKAVYSRGEDVTLSNPFGPPARGWADVSRTLERAAANYRSGEIVAFETVAKLVTPELAFTHELERFTATVVGRDEPGAITLRVTAVYRPEGGSWKLVHRHADPIATARPPESVLQ